MTDNKLEQAARQRWPECIFCEGTEMIRLTAEQAQQIEEIVEHLLVEHPTARHHKACVEALSIIRAARAQEQPHPDDEAVDRFAAAMKAKLAKKRAEGRGGWEDKNQCSAEFLNRLLNEHVGKGDPVDVGNLAMMLWNRGERTEAIAQEQAEQSQLADASLEPVASSIRGFSLWLDREAWGHVIDGLMLERERSAQRKAANPDSNSNIIADRCAELITQINDAGGTIRVESVPEFTAEQKDRFARAFDAAFAKAGLPQKQTEQEPVAYLHQWIEYHPFGDTVVGEPRQNVTPDSTPFDESDTVTPLYAAPIRTKDLTDEEIAQAYMECTGGAIITRCRAVIAKFKEKNK